MAEIITIPRVSTESENVKLIYSDIKKGDRLEVGDIIAEFESDRMTFELESDVSGDVIYTSIEVGKNYKTGDVLLAIGNETDNIELILNNSIADQEKITNSSISLANNSIITNGQEYSVLELVNLKNRLTKTLQMPINSSNEQIIDKIKDLLKKK